MKTKEIEIEWNGKKEKVVIRKLGFAERNTFMEKFTETKLIGDSAQVFIHPFKMKTLALQTCVVEAPFKTDIASLESLDPDVGDKIYEEIEKFNKLSQTKK